MEDEDGVNLVPVFHGADIEAQIVRALLEDNDIPAVTFGPGLLAEGDPGLRVMVRAADRDRAIGLLAETKFEEVELGDEWGEEAVADDEDHETYDAPASDVPVLAAPMGGGRFIAIAVALFLLGLAAYLIFQNAS